MGSNPIRGIDIYLRSYWLRCHEQIDALQGADPPSKEQDSENQVRRAVQGRLSMRYSMMLHQLVTSDYAGVLEMLRKMATVTNVMVYLGNRL
jgi:hypothetical protein